MKDSTGLLIILITLLQLHQEWFPNLLSLLVAKPLEHGDVMDNALTLYLLVPMFDAPLKPLVKFTVPTCINCLCKQGMGGLEGHAGLPALQPLPCLSKSCLDGEGHGHLVYQYTWTIGCCATWCIMPVLLSCHSLVGFKLPRVEPTSSDAHHKIHRLLDILKLHAWTLLINLLERKAFLTELQRRSLPASESFLPRFTREIVSFLCLVSRTGYLSS